MASGQLLCERSAQGMRDTGTLSAQSAIKVGGSTPAENVFVRDFDKATIEYVDVPVFIPGHYSGGGFTVNLWFFCTETINTRKVRFGGAFRRLNAGEDLSVAHTFDFNDVDITVENDVDKVIKGTITFTNGVDSDSVAAGEQAIFRIRREATHANDDADGDARLMNIEIRET